MAKRRKEGPLLRVAELFAGVGGFRLGLERASGEEGAFEVVFSNQWEPGRKRQYASDTYVARFGAKHHVNADIAGIDVKVIPDHDLLVGGFPCQDYSVASTLRNSKGLVGKKGVLWWQIHRILQDKKVKPKYLFLENVDRLLGSPVGQRGRDLAVMLRSLDELGYAIEWRVINAAEYGMPQRRRRVFLLGYHKSTVLHKSLRKSAVADWITSSGPMANAFPCAVDASAVVSFSIAGGLDELSKKFGERKGRSPFLNSGIMVGGVVFTAKTTPTGDGETSTLKDILQPEGEVPAAFYITKKDLPQWRYLKGSKKEPRTSGLNGHRYSYSEGAMVFPDALDRPSRTIITGEGGRSPSRFKHVVCADGKRYRRLTPVELERLNMFPDGHTAGVSDGWRAFFMGNALVVGVVERIGKALLEAINDHH
ncbi:MAG: DNA (cytosine-5-)-methyltransferase [Flavobacteriales bacterium]|nr:DNA (cytosine-5-)-methyltransferase [Flavobacteriales bacterium]